jgi:hypothetical protein
MNIYIFHRSAASPILTPIKVKVENQSSLGNTNAQDSLSKSIDKMLANLIKNVPQ